MTSHEVREYYESNQVDKLYKKCKKYFDLIDKWANIFIDGDILDENELKYAQQQLNGCQTLLNPIAGAFEALLIEYENDYFLQEEKKFDKIRIQEKDHCKAYARHKVSDIRDYASDFRSYCFSAQSAVVTAQSLLKRYSIEKANKEIGWSGDKSNVEE